jgi:dethiobiotin synthetase
MPGVIPLAVAVIGTDTGVGKTRVVEQLVRGLRAAGRKVWVHKPVACGGWGAGQAEDGRALAALAGDGQSLEGICPFQFPEPASPHLAAAAAGSALALDGLATRIATLRGDHDLVVEGVGGLLVPLTPRRETLCDLLVAAGLPALVVTRPQLGTLNHTALTVAHARRAGVPLLGLVVNASQPVDDSLATRSAVAELAAVTGLGVLAELAYRGSPGGPAAGESQALAAAVLGWQAATAAEHAGG